MPEFGTDIIGEILNTFDHGNGGEGAWVIVERKDDYVHWTYAAPEGVPMADFDFRVWEISGGPNPLYRAEFEGHHHFHLASRLLWEEVLAMLECTGDFLYA